MSTVPTKTTVLVIGGGPAGSYAASVLARANVDVTVLEGAKFPRYHIGESLLASTNYFLEYIDARKKVLEHGFIRKPGGAFKLRPDFPEAYTNFVDYNTGNHALNVVRAEYDDVLFRHAGSQGAKIFDGHKVTALQFSESDPDRPVAAEWKDSEGKTGTIAFDWVVDAAGRQGMLSTKYHKDRKMTESLRNTAVWAYWKNCKLYAAGTEREGAPAIEALHDRSGWCWYIPVNDNTISIGVTLHENRVKEKKEGKTLEEMYMKFFDHLSLVNELKAGGEMVPNKEGKGGPVYMASDYSYMSANVGAKNYRICGDSAAFIDPFFSSGVHLAFVGALSAALSILSVIEGRATEDESAEFHSSELKTAYTRYFVIVAAGYKQMRGKDGKEVNILNDVDEKSFQRAFDIIRPVIQGTGDIGVDNKSSGDSELSEKELQAAMDFTFHMFHHSELDDDVRSRLEQFRKRTPFSLVHNGVALVLEQAQERMRQSVAGELKLNPVGSAQIPDHPPEGYLGEH